MTNGIYLGERGAIQIKRTGDDTGFIGRLLKDDVNVNANRFSFDYIEDLGGGISGTDDKEFGNQEQQYIPLITGDRVSITRCDKDGIPIEETLELVDGATENSITAFVDVDAAAGIRLHTSFFNAVNRINARAIELRTPDTEEQYIKLASEGEGQPWRCVAHVTNFNFTTNREAIDLTTIGKNYRRFYSNGLISGQGQLDCFWDLGYTCGADNNDISETEYVQYLAELILRLEEGAVFKGRFVLFQGEQTGRSAQRTVFYDVERCIITSVAVTVEPTQLVRARVDFITSGPFTLKTQFLPSFMLQESSRELLLQENLNEIEFFDPID